MNTATNNSLLDEQPSKTVIDFLKWYRDNEYKIGRDDLVASDVFHDQTKFYSVNFDATEKYLNKLKSTGLISDKYIADWRDYFKKCDLDFKNNPQNDGPPKGFDYDLIMLGQDYEEELSNVEKASISEITGTGNCKTVKLKFHTGTILAYDLSLIDNKWYIDKIK